MNESSQDLDSVLAGISDAFVVLDRDWHFVFVNDKAAEFAGMTREEMLGKVCWEVFPTSVGSQFHAELQRAMQHQIPVRFEGYHSRLNGWLENRVYPVPQGLAMLSADVTARKRTEDALRFLAEAGTLFAGSLEYGEMFEGLVSLAVPRMSDWCAVDLVEEDGSIRRLAVQRTELGLERLDTSLGSVAAWVADTGQLLWFSSPEDTASGETSLSGLAVPEVRSLISVPLRPRSRPLGVLTFASMQPGRHYNLDDLELVQGLAYSAALALDNSRLFQRVVEEDRRKDEFLAMMAHELRNPLAPIVNMVEMLRLRGDDPEARHRATEMVGRQARHMARLLDDLLDVSRITYGKIGLRKEKVELCDVVRRALDGARPLFEAHGHRTTLTLPPDPIWLEADPARLEQVFANLLNNAAKFTPPGGKVGVEVTVQDDHAAVSVQDDGPGIPSELRSRIFDPFVQEDRSLDRPYGGLGIGLTLVRTLVTLHGGGVEAHSEGPGRGSEFVVRLPIVSQEALLYTAPAAGAEHAAAAKAKVLIVEDNPDAAQALSELLELWGHEVAAAMDGPAALKVVESFRPDVVLMDIGLPGMDGYELARRLRERPDLAGAHFIALTGYGQEADRRRSAEAGFDDHLTKPADPGVLRNLLANTRTG
ncbi:MAG TPA: ATP-binding protein [Thermoanaerobaculia bacterium]|nr:ATP-binding protein [Thermoanaerobaculia bacterium]